MRGMARWLDGWDKWIDVSKCYAHYRVELSAIWNRGGAGSAHIR